jgi:hypothetical protein
MASRGSGSLREEARKAKHFLSQTTGIAFQERIRNLEHVAMPIKATKQKPWQACRALRKALISGGEGPSWMLGDAS